MADIPNLPGVPALLTGFATNAFGAGVGLMVGDILGALFGGAGPQWGIFQNGMCVVTADTVMSFEFKRGWTIADYPVESGSFQTYDKVQTPYEPRFRFVSGMNPGNVSGLLGQIAAIAGDYNLYDVVTPNAVYPSVNITHYDYHRSGNASCGMVAVDVMTQQVIVTVSSTTAATTASPGGTPAAGSPPSGGSGPLPETNTTDGATNGGNNFGTPVSGDATLTQGFATQGSANASGFTPIDSGSVQGTQIQQSSVSSQVSLTPH